jgi:hypothetical protein
VANELYKQREWMHYQYVQKRRNLTDIAKILHNQYGVKVSSQTIYNWAKKFDLLKYRGKGRNLKPQVSNPQLKAQQSLNKIRKQQITKNIRNQRYK